MPDTKTQAEGTPCSLVLQPNNVKGLKYIRENSEHNLKCVYEKYMPREGLGVLRPNRSIPRHVTGLWNNGCLLKTVNYGGERGAWLPTPLSSFTPKEDGNQVREGKVTTVYS